jgi:hypothetical protein
MRFSQQIIALPRAGFRKKSAGGGGLWCDVMENRLS